MFGLTVMRFFYLDRSSAASRASSFSPVFVYTARNQIMIYLGTELYWDRSRNRLEIVPSYIKFPTQFWGIGRDAAASAEEDFTPEKIGIPLTFERTVVAALRLGASYDFLRHRLVKVEPNGVLASGSVPGSEPTTLSSFGVQAVWENRDSLWSASRGSYLMFQTRWYRDGLGSDYSYTAYLVDLRSYVSLWPRHVLALQLMGQNLDGEVPFFSLNSLGGDQGLRGYRVGRYIDKTRLIGQLEYRFNDIWWRFGAVVFAGLGDVAPKPSALALNRALTSYGFGLRYQLERRQKLNIRLDFGFGEGDSGFYLTLGEAF